MRNFCVPDNVDVAGPPSAAVVFNEANDKLSVLNSSVEIRFDVLILETERLDIATIDPNMVEAVKLDTTVFDPNEVDTFNVEPCRVLIVILENTPFIPMNVEPLSVEFTTIVLAVITFPIIVEKAI
jgi:hypothetical protein